MHLKNIHIESYGPIESVDVTPQFTEENHPKPLVLVGSNGSGKTNLLSIIADGLFEAAAKHFTDVLPNSGAERSWFRVIGGGTITVGKPGNFAALSFEHDDQTLFFAEKGGTYAPQDASPKLAAEWANHINWPLEGAFKEFAISSDTSEAIFENGAYVYFPASRSESPNWLNRNSVPQAEFEVGRRLTKKFRKPIYAERNIEQFQQWLLSVMIESRAEVTIAEPIENPPQLRVVDDWRRAISLQPVLETANEIIRIILDSPDARLRWAGRHGGDKLIIVGDKSRSYPGLSSLSAGQSTLLGIFGSLLRYGDNTTGAYRASEIVGMCLIDEIDAHMHVDLQFRALPKLMSLFPKVQFIVSSHSPLFVLGVQRQFNKGGALFVDMPSGNLIDAEAYSEFAHAFEVLRNTKAFNTSILEAADNGDCPIVFTEGETDPVYLRTAAQLLGRKDLLDSVEFEWIGGKNPDSGQSFNTGKDALDHALAMLKANPRLIRRTVILLYDCDAKKPSEDHEGIHVRTLPIQVENDRIPGGIENLLIPSAIAEEMFETTVKRKNDGGSITTTRLKKSELCRFLCETKRDAADFSNFTKAFDMLQEIITANLKQN